MDDAEREARRKRREAWAADNLQRQAAVMDDLLARAGDDPVRWVAVQRQARSFARHLATWPRGRGSAANDEMVAAHEARLDRWGRQGDARLARLGDDEREAAEA